MTAALPLPAAIVEEEPVQAALMVGFAEQRAHAPQKGGLEAGRELELDPSLLRKGLGQLLRLRIATVGDIGACQCGVANGGLRLAAGEEGLDLSRACGTVEKRLLGALGEQAPVWPGRIGVEEGTNLRRRPIAAAIEVPIDELARGRVGELVAPRFSLRQSSTTRGGHGFA
jgi:hypothetical protein